MKIVNVGIVAAGILCAMGTMAATTKDQHQATPNSTIDPGHRRFSPLTQITPQNVNNLKPAWVYDTGAKGRVWEAMPTVVDGVLYVTEMGAAVALEAETGKRLWKFAPKLERPGKERGIAYWPGDGTLAPRVIYTVTDRLYALDAKTGTPIASFGNAGMVNLRDEVADKYPDHLYTLSSPAAIYKNLAIVGPSTQEFGSQGPSGDPRAFDIRTGKLVWRFHTVPQPGEPQDGSWGPGGWKERAGPSAWGGISVDESLGLVYVPTGNPDDSYNGIDRPGNNYYANSIVALDASTGKLKWFFQMTHHDVDDYDAASAPTFLDIRKNGEVIPGLVEVPKSGLAFILDRRTGKPVFGVEERPVPQSDLPGEHLSPTQPFPVKPPPLVRTGMTRDDISTITPEAHDFCAAIWDKEHLHNEGPYTPASIKGTTVFLPGTSGGGNWGGVSSDPQLGYFFANVTDSAVISKMVADGEGGYKLEGAYTRYADPKGLPCSPAPWGELIAVNSNTGDIAWRTPIGWADEYGEAGKKTGTPSTGGSVATASGLLFIAATTDSMFRAIDSRTGKSIWTTKLPSPAVATPITFMGKNGRQYVVIASGGPGIAGASGRDVSYHQVLIAYALPQPGEIDLDLSVYNPAPEAPKAAPLPQNAATAPPAAAAPPPKAVAAGELPEGPGREDMQSMCGACHSVTTVTSQRHNSDGWKDLIQEMRERGAQGDDEKATRVQNYLARFFNVMPEPADAPAAPK